MEVVSVITGIRISQTLSIRHQRLAKAIYPAIGYLLRATSVV
jgi:hypothetical protein